MDYVESVLARAVVVRCESVALRRKLPDAVTLDGDSVSIAYTDKSELAGVLTLLQSLDVPFICAGPNPPSDVFELLQAEGLVGGNVRHIAWRGPGEPVFYDS